MNGTPDVFFYEAFKEEADALGKLLPEGMAAGFARETIQETGHTEAPAPVLSVRTQSILPIAWAPSLRAVVSRSTGYDHLHRYQRDAGRPDLPCGNLPLYCHTAVAEQALTMWMMLLRRAPKQHAQFDAFGRDGLTGQEAGQRTLLVVGVGNIGAEVVRLGKGIGMRVLGVDLAPAKPCVEYTDVDEAIPQADVIVCAMNLTQRNPGYFSRQRLGKCKPGAVFVNVSRGELSPSGVLLELLKAGRLGGVGLDVFNHEPALAGALRQGRSTDEPEVAAAIALSKRNDAICTPHNAFNTEEAVYRKAEHTVVQLEHFFSKGGFKWPAPPLD